MILSYQLPHPLTESPSVHEFTGLNDTWRFLRLAEAAPKQRTHTIDQPPMSNALPPTRWLISGGRSDWLCPAKRSWCSTTRVPADVPKEQSFSSKIRYEFIMASLPVQSGGDKEGVSSFSSHWVLLVGCRSGMIWGFPTAASVPWP